MKPMRQTSAEEQRPPKPMRQTSAEEQRPPTPLLDSAAARLVKTGV